MGDKAKGDRSVPCDYYMKQTPTLDNACGVIACLHAIYNNLGPGKIQLQADSNLLTYLSPVTSQSPEARAASLEGFTAFQEQHKSFAAQGQSAAAATQSDVKCHFVAFVVNSAGMLDGTKQGPNVVAEGCSDVLRGTVAEIQRRLSAGEISESLSMMSLNASSD